MTFNHSPVENNETTNEAINLTFSDVGMEELLGPGDTQSNNV